MDVYVSIAKLKRSSLFIMECQAAKREGRVRQVL